MVNTSSTPTRTDPNPPTTPQHGAEVSSTTTPQRAFNNAVSLLVDLLPLIGGNSARFNVTSSNRRQDRTSSGFDQSKLDQYPFHKACCSDSAGSIAQLHLMSQGDTNQIYQTIHETGDTPLHVACRFNAVNVVEYLIQMDSSSSLTSNPGRLLVMPTRAGYLPIHIAAEKGNIDCINLLLQASENKQNTLVAKTADGNTPLHLAIACARDLATIRVLLSPEALVEPDNHNNLPLHLALESKHQMPLWALLLDGDGERKTLVSSNDEGTIPFKFFLQHPLKLNEDFIGKYLSQTILSKFLQGQRLKYFDLKLHRFVAQNAEMQAVLNQASSNRLPVVTFVTDFYAHCASLTVLFILTENHLGLQDGYQISLTTMYILAGYFILREIIQLLSARRQYWKDPWNYADVARITMIIVLGHTIERIESYQQEVDEGFVRRIFLTVGVFMYIGAISFLRATFLPFALFVGGTSVIVVTLIPFVVSFGLALACMAYGFWVGGFGEKNDSIPFENYSEWLFGIFISALSGSSEFQDIEDGYISRYWWTTIYIILIQVIFLNVLIAIISSEWDRITTRQAEVFWRYRLEFVFGVLPAERLVTKYLPAHWKRAVTEFDNSLDKIRILDNVEWDVFPYREILKDTSLYWDRKAFVERLEQLDNSAEQSKQDWDQELGQYRSFQADYLFSDSFLGALCVLLRLVLCILWWILAFLLGCVTCGLFWPRRVRLFFFGPTSTSWSFSKPDNEARERKEKEAKDHTLAATLNGKLDAMNNQISELHATVDKLARIVAFSSGGDNPGLSETKTGPPRRESQGIRERFASM